jgi:uncharacterized membrane protein
MCNFDEVEQMLIEAGWKGDRKKDIQRVKREGCRGREADLHLQRETCIYNVFTYITYIYIIHIICMYVCVCVYAYIYIYIYMRMCMWPSIKGGKEFTVWAFIFSLLVKCPAFVRINLL